MAHGPVVDVHFHAVPPGFVDAVRQGALAEVLEIDARDGTDRLVFHAPAGVAVEPGLALRPRVHDAGLILAAMGRMGLDVAAVSSPPEYFMYWAPAEAGARLARLVNDGYAAWAAAHPGRFAPLATVPLQDPAAAVVELRRAVGTLGLRGVAVCTHVNGVDLDDARFGPFLDAAAELGAPVFLHPQNLGTMARLADHHLWNMVGFPAETAVAAARLVMSGALARRPGLKLVLAHGGGHFPYQLGRLDHGWRAREALRVRCPEPPSAYLRQIWCDSLVHDAAALRFLVERAGAGQVVLGSDHPFDMGDLVPAESVRAARLGAAVERGVLGGNLVGLLRL